jgi:hypothetical protein
MKEPPMKAMQIVMRDMQGQLAGAIVHAEESTVRLQVLERVSEDVSSGVLPLEGFSEGNAEALRAAIGREVVALGVLVEQMRLAYAYSIALSSRLQPE